MLDAEEAREVGLDPGRNERGFGSGDREGEGCIVCGDCFCGGDGVGFGRERWQRSCRSDSGG